MRFSLCWLKNISSSFYRHHQQFGQNAQFERTVRYGGNKSQQKNLISQSPRLRGAVRQEFFNRFQALGLK